MSALTLSPDELLSTTRAVRKRLDLRRPVSRDVLEDCLRLAQQAPSGSNLQNFHFVVVTDAEQRAGLAEVWRKGAAAYFEYQRGLGVMDDPRVLRLLDSVHHLEQHIHEVPVLVLPCIEGRTDGGPVALQAAMWASIYPATWSFMLAARSRGLGSVLTSFHLLYEREAADVVGIPYDTVMQAAMIPVAYTIGTDFKPARRKPLEEVVHWDRW
jgi:nitroreductase